MCVRGEQEQANNQPEGPRCRILAERSEEYTCRGSSTNHISQLYQPWAILFKKSSCHCGSETLHSPLCCLKVATFFILQNVCQ